MLCLLVRVLCTTIFVLLLFQNYLAPAESRTLPGKDELVDTGSDATSGVTAMAAQHVANLHYENQLAEEKQLEIRRLRQQINILRRESKETEKKNSKRRASDTSLVEEQERERAKKINELTRTLTKARRNLDNIRLLKRGVSHVNLVGIAAIQHELDDKRDAMRQPGSISQNQRDEVTALAHKLHKLKAAALLPSGSLSAARKPIEEQIKDTENQLIKSQDLQEKKILLNKIQDLRTARERELEAHIQKDMKLLQSYRLRLADDTLTELYRNLYREKIDAAYEVLQMHQLELQKFKAQLTNVEIEHKKRLRDQLNRFRKRQQNLNDSSEIASLQAEIDILKWQLTT